MEVDVCVLAGGGIGEPNHFARGSGLRGTNKGDDSFHRSRPFNHGDGPAGSVAASGAAGFEGSGGRLPPISGATESGNGSQFGAYCAMHGGGGIEHGYSVDNE